MDWRCRPFAELDAATVYAMLRLRSEVFVVEQRCVFLDIDGQDPEAWHLTGHGEDGALLAYCRLFAGAKIGRVLTAASARGGGPGRALMERGLAECARLWPGAPVCISAQAHLQRFYESLGFVVSSEPYDEDGITHIDMERTS